VDPGKLVSNSGSAMMPLSDFDYQVFENDAVL